MCVPRDGHGRRWRWWLARPPDPDGPFITGTEHVIGRCDSVLLKGDGVSIGRSPEFSGCLLDLRVKLEGMIIAEYTLDHPFLRETLQRVPELEVTWEDSYIDPDGRLLIIAWVDCEDFDALDVALADDSTVEEPTVLTEAGGRRLYRFELVGAGAESSIMSSVFDVGGMQLEITATSEGWRNRTRYPSRDAFERVYRFCLERDIDFQFHSIYEPAERLGHDHLPLSDAQRETLIEAVDSGYLDIPRGSSLEELGDRLGISESAASERFRRGVKALVEATIHQAGERGAQ